MFKALKLKKTIKKANTPSSIERTIDDILADEMKKLNETGRLTQKMLKVKLMRQEQKKTLKEIQELDDDLDDEYDEEEEEDTLENTIGKALINKLLGVPQTQNNNPIGPAFPELSNGGSSPRTDRLDLHDKLDTLPDEAITKLREMF